MAALQQQSTMPEWNIYHLTFHRKTLPTRAVDRNLSLRGAYSLLQTDNKKINILEWLVMKRAAENKEAGEGVRDCCGEVGESQVAKMT